MIFLRFNAVESVRRKLKNTIVFVNVFDVDNSGLFEKAKAFAGNGCQLFVGVISTEIDDKTLKERALRVKQNPFVDKLIIGTNNVVDGNFVMKYAIDIITMISGDESPCNETSNHKLVVLK